MSENMLVTVRASSWTRLFDCAHAWEGTHIHGIRSVSGMRAQLGTAIHASTAIYDESRMNHAGITPDEAADALVETLRHPDRDVDYTGSDLTILQAEKIGLTLHSRYCAEISPRYEFAAVELTTKPMEIDCGNGVTIRMTGTMDRARAIVGESGLKVGDLKSGRLAVIKDPTDRTGKRLVAKTRGHHAQIATYQILTEYTTGQEVMDSAEIIGLSTGTPAVATGEIKGARDILLGKDDQPGLIHYAAQMFKSGLFPPNPASQLCSPRYCGRWETCRFHP